MRRVGRVILTGMVGVPAVLFIVMGLRWLLDPAGIAPSLGLSLETGLGLSTQVGDLAAFFLVLGISTLIALVTGSASLVLPGGYAALDRGQRPTDRLGAPWRGVAGSGHRV